MATPLISRRRVARRLVLDDRGEGGKPARPMYRCEVHLYPRESGGYRAVSANLVGIEATGDTEAIALANVTSALIEAIPSKLKEDGRVDWQRPPVAVGHGGFVKVVCPSL